MPGLFGLFDYTKPGKGVEKEAPPKPRIIIFFEIFGRKFWALLRLNLMFLLFNAPAMIIAFFVTYFILPEGLVPLDTQLVETDFAALGELAFRAIFALLFCMVPVITFGPFQCGFSFVMRNYSREEHAFLWGDFIEHTKNNWKQSTIVMFIDIVVLSAAFLALSFYFGQEGLLSSFIFGIVFIGLLIFFMMHLYLYPMLVTFHVTIKQLYMNCFKFAMFRFFKNALIVLLVWIVTVLPFLIPVYGYVIGFTFLIFILFSFNGLLTNFYVYPLLKKYMLDKANGEQNESEEGTNEESIIEEAEDMEQTNQDAQEPTNDEMS